MRTWIVYEHGGGRTISHEQRDPWKQPLNVVALDDVIAWMREDATNVDERAASDLIEELQRVALNQQEVNDA